ncbi:SDR family oxidoreductase [Nitrospirillum bahiense]|nr:SDR family oxidoreductase [Nitrospirillum amazonense]
MMTADFLSRQLAGSHVLIVGGTSGIGLSAAIQAKAAGAEVIILGLDKSRAEQIAAEHGFAGWRSADVTRPETIEKALADVGHVDHLVLLAGSFVVGRVLDADLAQLHRAFDERIWAAIHTLRALGDRLATDGSITFISGALGDRPNGYGTAVLAAASSAMESLGRGLALELAPRRVNTLSPGPIDTPLLGKALGDRRNAYVEGLKTTLPLHRLGTAEEAGVAVVFLMANGWMNGATLNIDGGSRLV